MSKNALFVAACMAGVAAFVLLTPAGAASSRETQEVEVINFPETQRIAGTVGVDGIVHGASLTALRGIEVPPVARGDVNRLVPAGVLDLDGFASVRLSLAGQARGTILRPGEVGAILIPAEEPILKAFDEKGLTLFTLEVAGRADSMSTWFGSAQPRFDVAFPRYQVLLYNTTDRAVMVDLFAYRTN